MKYELFDIEITNVDALYEKDFLQKGFNYAVCRNATTSLTEK